MATQSDTEEPQATQPAPQAQEVALGAQAAQPSQPERVAQGASAPCAVTAAADAGAQADVAPNGEPASGNIVFDIILASASPRRKQLLEEAGVVFEVRTADVDETLAPDDAAQPTEAVKKLAERKAGAIVQQILGTEGFTGSVIVIGADTMVVSDGKIFGKPHSLSEGTYMLRSLSGKVHQVHTAVSVWLVHAPAEQDISLGYRTLVDTSDVAFKQLSDQQIAEYLRKGESFDKAGAYAVQGEGAALVDHVDGYLSTVIGLPVERLLAEFPDIAESSKAKRALREAPVAPEGK